LLDQVPFYEREDLTAIKASGNMLKVVEPYIGMFGALKNLDVSDWGGPHIFKVVV
jgi:hypothetical protein